MSLTRIVQAISSMHASAATIRSGKTTETVGAIVFDPKHFPKFLAGCMMTSGLAGFFTMEWIQQKNWERRDAVYDKVWDDHEAAKERGMSHNEAMLSAMIENSKNASLKENLDNAMEAHEHFMLGSEGRRDPEFLTRIRERSNELRNGQERDRQQHLWATGE